MPPTKPTNAPKQSLFAAMRKDAKLSKHMEKAKNSLVVREFDGPDGDYTCYMNRISSYMKNGDTTYVIEFVVADSTSDYDGHKLVMFFSLKTTEWNTKEEIQDQLFQTFQLMGVTTAQDDELIEKELEALRLSRQPMLLRTKTSAKGFINMKVVGVTEQAADIEQAEYTVEEEAVATADEEWPEEAEEAVEDELIEEEAAVDSPSAWDGYEVIYKGNSFLQITGNDETMKCIIESLVAGYGGKKVKYNVAFESLTFPTSD